jgi:hypothetical protein
MALIMAIAACGTSPAPAFKGRWQPLNRFPATTQAIPLDTPYVFHASPMDGTLKQMLARWATDANMPLSYQHTVDFTVHTKAARVRTRSLSEALALLQSAYLAQRLEILAEDGRIVVRPMNAVVRTPPDRDTEAAH